jgi:hypothetical protein
MNPNRCLERAETACEIEMLILRKMLIGEDQHGVFCKGIFDREEIGGFDLLRQIDVADLSGKTWRDRNNRDGHVLILEVAVNRLDHFGSLYSTAAY